MTCVRYLRLIQPLEFFNDNLELYQQCSVFLVGSVSVKVPARLFQLVVKVIQQGKLDRVGNRHVVLDGIESSKHKVENADLKVQSRISGSQGGRNVQQTYHSSQVSIQFLNDHTETSTCHVEESPTVTHGFSIPSRSNMFARVGDVPLRVMPY